MHRAHVCRRLLVLTVFRRHARVLFAGERWAKTVDSLRQNYDVLTGDMLLAAAFISYAGPFTNKVRASLIKEWMKFLNDKGTPMTAGITGEAEEGPSDAHDFSCRSPVGFMCGARMSVSQRACDPSSTCVSRRSAVTACGQRRDGWLGARGPALRSHQHAERHDPDKQRALATHDGPTAAGCGVDQGA